MRSSNLAPSFIDITLLKENEKGVDREGRSLEASFVRKTEGIYTKLYTALSLPR